MNPYHRPDHRQAFDLAVELINGGQADYREIAKRLDHSITREQRLKIAAKVCRLHSIKPLTFQQRIYGDTISGVAIPQTDEEAEALAMWIQATPEQRLVLLCEMRRLGKMLSGQFEF